MKQCAKCKKVYDDSWGSCLKCNEGLVHIDGSPNRAAEPANVEATEQKTAPVTFYNTSILKMVLLSVFTLGLYEIYWHYKNWKCVQSRTKGKLYPALRAWFLIFFCHDLFKRIAAAAKGSGYEKNINVNLITTGYILYILIGNISGRFETGNAFLDLSVWFVSFLSIFFLVIMQNAVNHINAANQSEFTLDSGYNWKSIVILILGGIFMFLIILATFFPQPTVQ